MTAATPIPTSTESPLMDQTTEADPDDSGLGSPPEALSSGQASSPAAAVRPTLRGQVAENPLASFLGAVIVALLVSMLATTNIRINRLEDRVDALDAKFDAKFDALDAKFDAKFDALDARFDALDAKFDDMNLKLTALIAKLNATDDVDAAVEGRLTGRASGSIPDPADSGAASSTG